jgi:hypothetical protein
LRERTMLAAELLICLPIRKRERAVVPSMLRTVGLRQPDARGALRARRTACRLKRLVQRPMLVRCSGWIGCWAVWSRLGDTQSASACMSRRAGRNGLVLKPQPRQDVFGRPRRSKRDYGSRGRFSITQTWFATREAE